MDKELTPEEVVDDRDILDAPLPWCSKIDIPRTDFNARFPGGHKAIRYRDCLVEKYSDYFKGKHGLVLKLVTIRIL